MIDGNRILSKGNVYSQCKKYYENYKTTSYTELAYLSTDGNQWIDTGFIPDNNTRVVMDVFLYKQSSYPTCIFGARKGTRTSSNGSAFCLWSMEETYFRTDYDNNVANFNALRPKGRRAIDKNKETTKIDDTSWAPSPSTFNSSVTLRLFTNHSDQEESVDTRQAELIFYSCQIYDDGTLVRDFIPVLKNGIAQIYDKLNKTYYASQGSKPFIAGPENTIPKNYVPLEYIESVLDNTNEAPYIDTGILTSSDTNISVKFKFSQVNRWTHSCVIGGRGAASGYANRLGFGYNKNSGWRFDFKSSNAGDTASSYLNEQIASICENLGTVNDGTELTVTDATFTGSYNLWLFAYNTADTLDAAGELRMYWCDIDAPSGKRAFRPVKRKSDGLAGMYDLVQKRFYTSLDSARNDFIAGPELSSTQEAFPDEPTDGNVPAMLNDVDTYLDLEADRTLGNRPISASNLKRVFMNLLGDGIFPDYTPLEYLESSYTNDLYSGSFIQTDILPKNSLSARGKIRPISYPDEAQYFLIFGGRSTNTSNADALIFYYYAETGLWHYTNFGSDKSISGTNPIGRDIDFRIDNGNVRVDNLNFTSSKGSSAIGKPFKIFCTNSNQPADTCSQFRLYYIDFVSDGVQYGFRPVKRNSDNVLGMFDTVNKQFYPGQGLPFTAGPEITESEIEKFDLYDYIELEYIQSSGSQRIDTGFIPNSESRIVMDCYRINNSSADHFFGVRTGSQSKNGFSFYIYNSGWRSGYGNQGEGPNGPSSGHYLIDKNKNVATINDGEVVITSNEQTFTCEGTAYLFAMNNTGMNPGYGTLRLYNCQIYDDGVLVRDFIPVKRLSDNVVCLYDRVANMFYTNSGSGSFTAGPEL